MNILNLGVYNQDRIVKKMINIQLVRFILLSNKEVNLILYAKQYFCSLKINVFYSWSHFIYKDKIYINLRTWHTQFWKKCCYWKKCCDWYFLEFKCLPKVLYHHLLLYFKISVGKYIWQKYQRDYQKASSCHLIRHIQLSHKVVKLIFYAKQYFCGFLETQLMC